MTAAGDKQAQRAHVERIVREVLAELARKQSPAPPAGKEGAAPAGKELVVSEKVISAAQLEKQLPGIERLIVPRGAVITPAARDLLREKNVAIASAVNPTTAASDKKQLILALDGDREPTSLTNWIANTNTNAERIPQSELATVIDQLCQRLIGNNALGLILTHSTATALCLANRRRGIRAALATSTDAVAAAMNSVAANVLVVDPEGKTSFEWNRLLAAWTDVNRPELPAALREQLG